MYDVIIIGAGPAGLTASIYASCYNLSHLVIGQTIGGQLMLAPFIVNYPGFSKGISGSELTSHLLAQAKFLGGEIVEGVIKTITPTEKNSHGFQLKTTGDTLYETEAIIIATGTKRRTLGVKGEDAYLGRGVYYCATCEPTAYVGKDVSVVGAGNSAFHSALFIAKKAKSVSVYYRGETIRADPKIADEVAKISSIRLYPRHTIVAIVGNGERVVGITLESDKEDVGGSVMGKRFDKDTEAVFIEIGGVPGSEFFSGIGMARTPFGYLPVDAVQQTNVPNIFAAGDVVSEDLYIEQIATAVGSGAKAASSCFQRLKRLRAPTIWGHGRVEEKNV